MKLLRGLGLASTKIALAENSSVLRHRRVTSYQGVCALFHDHEGHPFLQVDRYALFEPLLLNRGGKQARLNTIEAFRSCFAVLPVENETFERFGIGINEDCAC